MLDQLRASITRGEAVLVIGAGVTANATGDHAAGTWRGLISNGLARVVEATPKKADWLQRQEWLLDGDVHDLIGVAQQVETRLRRAKGFSEWLEELVGGLRVNRRTIYDAISKSRAPVMTTNYDKLIEHATGMGTRSWQEDINVGTWLRRPASAREVLHLHGVYDTPKSVVLGNTSYQSLLLNDQAQFVQKALAATNNLVFVGCGSTTEDPNLGALLDWIEANPGSRQHFRLCLHSEVEPVKEAAADGSRIAAIPYGHVYDDLADFVARYLCHPEEALTHRMRDLVVTYLGTPDGVDGEIESWGPKDKVVGAMREETRVSPPDLDGLRLLPGAGYRMLALASMMNDPCASNDARIDRMCVATLPVNAAFKVCDYVGGRVRDGAAPGARGVLTSILDKVHAMWPVHGDLQRWLAAKRAELAAAA